MVAERFRRALACVLCLAAAGDCSGGDWLTRPAPVAYELVRAWGDSGSGDGQFRFPWGVVVDGSGNGHVADAGNKRIEVFTRDGSFLHQWGDSGSADGQFGFPLHLARDAGGNVYVTDSGNHRLQKFTSDGSYLTGWGTFGSGDGQFVHPNGVAVDDSGHVYVTDRGNRRVQKFSADGVYLAQWGSHGHADGQFESPRGIAVDDSGNVYVADGDETAGGYHHRIQKFTRTGAFLTRWGGYGQGPGQFDDPDGVAVDADGSVCMAIRNIQRVQGYVRRR